MPAAVIPAAQLAMSRRLEMTRGIASRVRQAMRPGHPVAGTGRSSGRWPGPAALISATRSRERADPTRSSRRNVSAEIGRRCTSQCRASSFLARSSSSASGSFSAGSTTRAPDLGTAEPDITDVKVTDAARGPATDLGTSRMCVPAEG